jgi:hypothetical protein
MEWRGIVGLVLLGIIVVLLIEDVVAARKKNEK